MSDDIQKHEFKVAVISGRHFQVASCISRGGADPAWRYDYGCSALHLAAGHGHVRVAKVLLARGWDIEAKDDGGGRPLHWAALLGHLQMIQLLVRRGAMVDCQRNCNSTPLHSAAGKGHSATVSLLLNLGADRTIKNNDGETAEDIAKVEITRTAAATDTTAKKKKTEKFRKILKILQTSDRISKTLVNKSDVGPGHVTKRSQESGSTPPASSSSKKESRRRCSHPPLTISPRSRHGELQGVP